MDAPPDAVKKVAPEAGAAERADAPRVGGCGAWLVGTLVVFLVGMTLVVLGEQAKARESARRWCFANLKTLEGAYEMWLADGHPAQPACASASVEGFRELGYIQQLPGDPAYFTDEGMHHYRIAGPGRVLCIRHGARSWDPPELADRPRALLASLGCADDALLARAAGSLRENRGYSGGFASGLLETIVVFLVSPVLGPALATLFLWWRRPR